MLIHVDRKKDRELEKGSWVGNRLRVRERERERERERRKREEREGGWRRRYIQEKEKGGDTERRRERGVPEGVRYVATAKFEQAQLPQTT